MKIVTDDRIPFIRGVFEPYADVVYLPGAKTTPDDVRDADAVITRTRTKCDAGLLAGSKVKIVATATIGFDHIDTVWCENNGIAWKSAPGCNSGSVKQYVASALVTLCRRHGLDFRNLTLGVVGVGNVGAKVVSAARAMGMKVLLNDPPRARREGNGGFVPLEELIERADIITLHVPLNRGGEYDTVHLFDAARLSSLRPGQILINSSRGPVVDNEVLKKILASGGIRAAVLDVWENEPEPDPELVSLLDICTPHIAGYSADGKANGTMMSVRAVAEALDIEELKGWKVTDLPLPARSLGFSIDDAAPLSLQQLVERAVLHAYDVTEDSDALRGDLAAFERLRGEYPVRREFQAFTVRLRGASASQVSALRQLGFNVIENQ
ncbi:MAG: 4-phosphoerythronate dehydrogenase PdxB [Bacteroidales bacterium]|nr:4-phosphoerythronate dehydrogenase PdxB [Bacteroidales bacterium]